MEKPFEEYVTGLDPWQEEGVAKVRDDRKLSGKVCRLCGKAVQAELAGFPIFMDDKPVCGECLMGEGEPKERTER